MGRMACREPQCLYSTAITLLRLRAVQHLESRRPPTLKLYIYYHCGPESFTNSQCLYSTVSPIIPYGTNRLYTDSVPLRYRCCSITSMGRTECTETRCLYGTPKPLIPLWDFRNLDSLSDCRVHLNLYKTYGPYGLYRASVRVQCS